MRLVILADPSSILAESNDVKGSFLDAKSAISHSGRISQDFAFELFPWPAKLPLDK
jgi:hypothetical protein